MQRHQRGSIIGFVVVGALLAIAVVGGIYLVKNQLDGNLPGIPSGDDVAMVEDEADQAEGDVDSATEQSDESTDTSGEATDQPDQTDEQSSENRDEPQADDQSDIPQTGVDSDDDDTAEDLPQTGVAVEQLPQTGLADGVYALVALGALTGSIVAFRRSNLL